MPSQDQNKCQDFRHLWGRLLVREVHAWQFDPAIFSAFTAQTRKVKGFLYPY
jgi:hypothetical protein